MIASQSEDQSFNGYLDPAPELPEGWKLETRTLEEDFVLYPEGRSDIPTKGGIRKPVGEFACGYVLVWD